MILSIDIELRIALVTRPANENRLKCKTGGVFDTPNWPTCKAIVACPNPPLPPSGSNLAPTDSKDLKSFGEALYKCKDGFKFQTVGTDNFKVACDLQGKFDSVVIKWPTCIAANRSAAGQNGISLNHIFFNKGLVLLLKVKMPRPG